MTTKRKTLTKSLHTVTAVSRLAVYIYKSERRQGNIIEAGDAIDAALSVLELPVYPWQDPTMANIVGAVSKLLNGEAVRYAKRKAA